MRSSLVIDIVKSFSKGKENFIDAVKILAQEELKKGNEELANKLLLAIEIRIKVNHQISYFSHQILVLLM